MSWSANSYQTQSGNANFSGGHGGTGAGSSSIMSDRSGPVHLHAAAGSPSHHGMLVQDAFGNNVSNSSSHSHHSHHSHHGSLSRASIQSSQHGGGNGGGGGHGGGTSLQPQSQHHPQQQQQQQKQPGLFSNTNGNNGSVAPQQLQLGMLSHPSVAASLNRSVGDMMDLDRETTPLASTASVSTASRSPSPESSPLVFPNDPPSASLAQAVTMAAMVQGVTSSGMPSLTLPGSAFADPQSQQQQQQQQLQQERRGVLSDKSPFDILRSSSISHLDPTSAQGGPPTISSGMSDVGGSTGAPPILSADQSQALQSSTQWATGAPIDDPTAILGGPSMLEVLGVQQVAAMYDQIPPEFRDQWHRMLSDPFSPETFEVLFNMAGAANQQQQQQQPQQPFFPGNQGFGGSSSIPSSMAMPGMGNPLVDAFGNRLAAPQVSGEFGVGLSSDTLLLPQQPSMSNLLSSSAGPVTAAAAGSVTVGGGLLDPAIRQTPLAPATTFASASQTLAGSGLQQQQLLQGSGSFNNPIASMSGTFSAFVPPQQHHHQHPLFAQQLAATQPTSNRFAPPGMMASTPPQPPLLSSFSSMPGSGEFGSSDSMMNPPMTPGHGTMSEDGFGGAASVKSPATVEKPKKVPRPENSYFLYRRSVYNAVKAANPHLSNPNISKIISDMWRNESAEVKAHYKELSIIAKEEHSRQYPDYKYQPRRKPTSKVTAAIAASTARKKRESIELSAAMSVTGSRPPSVMPGDHDGFMDDQGNNSDTHQTPPMPASTLDTSHAHPPSHHPGHQVPPLSGQLGSGSGGSLHNSGTPPTLTIPGPDSGSQQQRPPSAGGTRATKRPGSPLHMPLRTSHSVSGGPGGLHPTLSSPTFLSTSETSSLRSSLLRGGSGSTQGSMRQLSDASNSMMHLYQSHSHSDGSFDTALNNSMPALVIPADQQMQGVQSQGQGQGHVPGAMGPPHTLPKRSGSALSHEWNGAAGVSAHMSPANQVRMVAGLGGQQVQMQQQLPGGMGSNLDTPQQQSFQLANPPVPGSIQWAGMQPQQLQHQPMPPVGFGGSIKWPSGPTSQPPTPTPQQQQQQQQQPVRSLAQSLDPRAATMSPADFANTLRASLSSGQISIQDAQQLQQVHLQMYQQHQQQQQQQMQMAMGGAGGAGGGGFSFGGGGGGISGPQGQMAGGIGSQGMMGGGLQQSQLMMPMQQLSGDQQQVMTGPQASGMGSWLQRPQQQGTGGAGGGQGMGVMVQQPQQQVQQPSMSQQQPPPPMVPSSGWS